MSNETLIALLQNQLADLELQLSQLQHRAETLRNTIISLKSELSNTAAVHQQTIIQVQAANDLAKTALQNAQQASSSLAEQRDELNAFIEHTAQQIEVLANKAQSAIAQQPQQLHTQNDNEDFTHPTSQPTVEPTFEPAIAEPSVEPTPEPIVEPEPVVEPKPIVAEQPSFDTEQPLSNSQLDDNDSSQEEIRDEEEPAVQEYVEEPIIDVPQSTEEHEPEPEVAQSNDETEEAQIDQPQRTEQPDQSSIIPKISDIKAGISIGDRFLFQRQLFKNSGELMNKTIARLNEMTSFEEAMDYCERNFSWDKDSNAYELFTNVLRRRY